MCGIFGALNTPNLNPEIIKQKLIHRGPDAQDILEVDEVFFYHFRLAILDIEGGKQPMSYKQFHLIFNGQIYNHQDLREKYNLVGASSSDTETLLLLYEKLGTAMLDELEGMFALSIYDDKTKELLLARDRAGKKPLFYCNDNQQVVFSSELNALRSQLDISIDAEAVQNYLELGFFYKSETPYQNIKALESGEFIRFNAKGEQIEKKKWWSIETFYQKRSKDSFEQALEQTDVYLRSAIKRRLESSDLEVASFLSGGIDSGLVTAIASEYTENLKTFTVAFDGTFDESGLAEDVAKMYKTDHKTIRVSFDDLENDIEKIALQHGLPFMDTSSIPSYYVAKEAKKHVTVVLNGDGGDELFGGYRRSVPFAKYDFFKPSGLVKSMSSLAQTVLPVSHQKQNLYNYFYRLTSLASKGGYEAYLAATYDLYTGFEAQAFKQATKNTQLRSDFEQINQKGLSGLNKLLQLDFEGQLFGDLLVKMDIATMHNALEGRSPFLAKDLLEYIPTLPESYKIRGKSTKFILRELSKKYLPDHIINQPKRGFEIPLKQWVDGILKAKIEHYVFDADCYWKQVLNADFVTKLHKRELAISDERRAKMLYQIFALELWYKNLNN
ncbi:MAG: asparagine synthase (glutamine-hydrolyzing) [Flavobacteriales bacterium]